MDTRNKPRNKSTVPLAHGQAARRRPSYKKQKKHLFFNGGKPTRLLCMLVLLLIGAVGVRAVWSKKKPQAQSDNSQQAISTNSGRWSLILANTNVPLPESYESTVTYVQGPTSDQQCDSRILEPLTRMFEDAAADGIDLYFRSGYRSFSTQQYLFNAMYEENLAKGMTEDEAYAATKSLRNIPGTSEHETGLAVDIVPLSDPRANLVDELENTKEIQWLHAHCAEYGFILRYPKGKTDITGTSYEPWHFRYVGVEDAQKIMAEGITLEEYLVRSSG